MLAMETSEVKNTSVIYSRALKCCMLVKLPVDTGVKLCPSPYGKNTDEGVWEQVGPMRQEITVVWRLMS